MGWNKENIFLKMVRIYSPPDSLVLLSTPVISLSAVELSTAQGVEAKAETQLWGLLSVKQLKHLVAGGVAGAVSRTCVSPLERMKILYQVGSLGMRPASHCKPRPSPGPGGTAPGASSVPRYPAVPGPDWPGGGAEGVLQGQRDQRGQDHAVPGRAVCSLRGVQEGRAE